MDPPPGPNVPWVLSALDHAEIQWYHFKAIIITGMGLFTDAYDLFSITLVLKIIGRIYYYDGGDKPGVVPFHILSTVVGIALLGTAFGQLIFGYLGDHLGRKSVYGFSLLLMVVTTIASGFSACKTSFCTITTLCLFRFFLGLGIGGDYPLSATIMAEFANKDFRARFIAGVFCMQGLGILTSLAVTAFFTSIFNAALKPPKFDDDHYKSTPSEADFAWRLILMFGAIPAGLTYYWRSKMKETARYTAVVKNEPQQAAVDMNEAMELHADPNQAAAGMRNGQEIGESRGDDIQPMQVNFASYDLFSWRFFNKFGKDLIVTSVIWFLVDVVFYSSNLFQFLALNDTLSSPGQLNVFEEVLELAKYQSIIALASTIPGYLAAVATITNFGRIKIQGLGFLGMAVCLLIAGTVRTRGVGFIIPFGLTFFFANWGPNTTSFIVPAELFPAGLRCTCHGIAGAWGKVGAIIGTILFYWTAVYVGGFGIGGTLMFLAGVSLAGVVVTYLWSAENTESLEVNESVRR